MNRQHRVVLFGHVTSLGLEDSYWRWLGEIAKATGTMRWRLIETIAMSRGHRSLASAVRCFITAHFAGSPAIYRSDRRLVRARDGGVHVVDTQHATVSHWR
jgi:predicted DNA-binding ribbon-helix-helix protein